MQLLSEWRRVHEATVGPETVEPALKPNGTTIAEIAFVNFSVIADRRYDRPSPFAWAQSDFANRRIRVQETLR